MATKIQLQSRVEYMKECLEQKGIEYKYTLPKNPKREDFYKILNDMDQAYKKTNREGFNPSH